MNIFSMAGKNVLVTGATGHLGKSIVWALAAAGANVLVNSRDSLRCDDLVRLIRAKGLLAESASFDVNNEEAVTEFFSQQNLILSCLINNAYSGEAGTIESSNLNSYRSSYEIALVSAHSLLVRALPVLRESVKTHGDASVINIASMYGLVSPDLRVYDSPENSNPPFYGAAKAALIQWTRYAACEFGPEGIRVNAISPGPFPSQKVQTETPGFVSKLVTKVPLGRIGDPNELGGPVVFLASKASSFVNGANISVDGGWTSW